MVYEKNIQLFLAETYIFYSFVAKNKVYNNGNNRT